MENLNKGKLNRAVIVLTKILEVIHWIGAVLMGLLTLGSIVFRQQIASFLEKSEMLIQEGSIKTYGMDITVINPNNTLNMTAVMLYAIGALLIMILVAMIFRNAYLILQTAGGKTSFAKGATPFQEDVVRMFREIGYFLIGTSVVGLVLGIIVGIVVGAGAAVNINLMNLVIGLLVLSLSQYFAYGMELQEDVDGLL